MSLKRSVVVWAGLVGVVLANAVAVRGDSGGVAETVDRYRKSSQWCQSVSMKIEVHTEVEGMPDKKPYVTFQTFDRDGNRVAWRGEMFQLDAKGNPDVSRGSVLQNVGTGKEMYQVIGEPGKLPLGASVRASGYQEILSRLLEDLGLGAPLWGAIPGTQHKSLADLLGQADPKGLRMRDETLGADVCRVLGADTPYGKLTIWVAPEKGYQALRWELVKGLEDRYDDKTLTQLGLKTWTMTFEASQVDRIQGCFVVTKGVLTRTIGEGNGNVNMARHRYSVSNVNLSPDFSSPAVFALNVPNGTWIDRESRGVRLEWQDGKAVPAPGAGVDTKPAPASAPPWWQGYLLWGSVALAGCLAAGVLLWRRARRAGP